MEFVVRAIKEVGLDGLLDQRRNVLTPLLNMGQQLFEPPDVNGWELGPGWFSSGAMLARMNFAVDARGEPEVQPARSTRGQAPTPEALVVADVGPADAVAVAVRRATARSSITCAPAAAWTGSDTQLATKAAGLAHLIVGSGDYQFV